MSYSREYYVTRERWRDWRIEARELVRLAQIERGARALEVGCGGGGLLKMLLARGADAVGVDTLVTALQMTQSQRQVAGNVAGDAQTSPLPLSASGRLLSLAQISDDNQLPFQDNAFDAILGQHIIEHISNASAALREWQRVLKSHGHLALATPNADYPDPEHFSDAEHAHIFSPPELAEIVQGAGFVVEDTFTIFPYLSHSRLLRASGVVGYNVFRHIPYFRTRGRTILLSARKK